MTHEATEVDESAAVDPSDTRVESTVVEGAVVEGTVVEGTAVEDADLTIVADATAKARFEQFCADEHASMANALGWALGSHDLGREAADEAFARAYERWDTVDTMSNPAGWVYRVGLNWGRRRIWRRNKERQLLSTIDLDDQHDAYVDEDLAKALAALPIKFRSVVVLRHLLGYSERDTAEALGISPGTAKSRMSRGLERLRTHLETAS